MLHMHAAFGLMLIVPCIIALIREGSNKSISGIAGSGLVVGLLVAAWAYVDPLRAHLPHGSLGYRILGILAIVAGLLMVIKLSNQVIGTIAACGGILFGLMSLNLLHWVL